MASNRLNLVLGLLLGGALGGFAGWYLAKVRYDKLLDARIEDVRQSFERVSGISRKESNTVTEPAKRSETSKPSLAEYAATIKKENYQGYYTGTSSNEKEWIQPYIITPTEYVSDTEYETVSLCYTMDGVLINENDEKVDIETTIGKECLSHFGEYEADSVFVRNPNTNTDYEVLLDNRYWTSIMEERRGPSKVTIEG